MNHDETKLPKWVQDKLLRLREERDAVARELERLKQAHAVLSRDDWFTIPGPPEGSVQDDRYYLFYLSCSGAHPACSLGVGDVLLIGRAKK